MRPESVKVFRALVCLISVYISSFGLVFAQESISSSTATQNELLLRLDDRTSEIADQIVSIEETLSKPGPFWTGATVVGLVAAISAAFSGFLVAWYNAKKTAETAQANRVEAHLFDSLRFFEGGTQNRSIGLSIIEANWEAYRELRPTWTSILIKQAVYLLAVKPTDKKSKMTEHEFENRKNILILLKNAEMSVAQKKSLDDAVSKAGNLTDCEQSGWSELLNKKIV